MKGKFRKCISVDGDLINKVGIAVFCLDRVITTVHLVRKLLCCPPE